MQFPSCFDKIQLIRKNVWYVLHFLDFVENFQGFTLLLMRDGAARLCRIREILVRRRYDINR